MKKLIFFSLLIFSISIALNLKPYAAKTAVNEMITKELLIEEAFLKSMSGEILNAIEDYYGELWLYFLPRITNVTKNEAEDNFDVTVQVVTYQRAIMPPYGLETITFRIPGYKVLNFKHKEIKGEDLPKDKFNPDVNKKSAGRPESRHQKERSLSSRHRVATKRDEFQSLSTA